MKLNNNMKIVVTAGITALASYWILSLGWPKVGSLFVMLAIVLFVTGKWIK